MCYIFHWIVYIRFFFVCLTCEYDRIPCNDGDNLPHKHCMVDRNCNCSGAADSNVFLICASKTFYRMFSILWTKKKTKQNRVNAVVESAGIPYSNYNNYISFEMIKWLKFNFQLTFNSFSIFFKKLGHFYGLKNIAHRCNKNVLEISWHHHQTCDIHVPSGFFCEFITFSVNWILLLDIANSWTSIQYEQFNRFFRIFLMFLLEILLKQFFQVEMWFHAQWNDCQSILFKFRTMKHFFHSFQLFFHI